ncbi:MAG: RNA polymerase factor sigma-54 [Bacillota bacterium]
MMKLDYELKLEQTQKLIITPELKLAITLLQYSSLELLDYIQEELLNNPVLEIREDAEEEKANPNELNEEVAPEPPARDDFPWEDYFRDMDLDSAMQSTSFSAAALWEGPPSIENCAVGTESMTEDLLGQLRLMPLSRRQYTIAAYLVGNLDQNGYLRGDLEELAQALGVALDELEAVLEIVQDLDPRGIACRNLQECLLIQLSNLESPPQLAVEIVKHYLPAAADGRFRHIAARLACEPLEVQEAVDFIRTLNPKPGSVFGEGSETRYIIPDIIAEKVGEEYVVIFNDSGAPQLAISPFYQKLLKNGGKDEQLSTYIKGKFEKAYWLIRSIEQRRLTLYKVSQKIIEIQQSFLEQGIKQLKPLTLKEVAQQVGVHESTVSRATNNKYIQTPRGLFPLKFFFSSGLSGEGGEDYSSHCIKTYLRELITAEDPRNPLSDQLLTEALQERGIIISRRTVAKYREELSIPASYKRRRV